MTLTIKFKGLDKLMRDLEKAKSTAVPYAMKTALNSMAQETRRLWVNEIRGTFTTRNQFTERSVLVSRATGKGGNIQASVGSTAPYMGEREVDSETHGRSGLKGIPGPAAAGQAPGTHRTRLVRAGNRLGALSVPHPTKGGSKKQRNAIAIAMAVKQGKKAALLERAKGGKAIFQLVGGQRAWRKRGGSMHRSLQFRLLWDFSRGSYAVPAHPTLGRALRALEPKVESMCVAAVIDQFRRHRICGY